MPQQIKHASKNRHASVWRSLITAGVLVAAVALLYSHRATFSASLSAIRHSRVSWLLPVVLLATATFFVASGTYVILALHKLRYGETLIIELATAFVNRLLPAGLGGLGLLGRYLYKRKHTSSEAAVIVSINNLLGVAAHLLLLALVALSYPDVFRQFKTGHIQLISGKLVGIILVALVAVCLIKPIRIRIMQTVNVVMKSLGKLRWQQILSALLLSVALTMLFTMVLFCSTRALGIQLGVVQIFVAFSISVLASTVTPTPGGLVGAEAGLLGGLTAFGVSTASAGAVVVIYRTATYWLPLLPGYIALLIARRRKLV